MLLQITDRMRGPRTISEIAGQRQHTWAVRYSRLQFLYEDIISITNQVCEKKIQCNETPYSGDDLWTPTSKKSLKVALKKIIERAEDQQKSNKQYRVNFNKLWSIYCKEYFQIWAWILKTIEHKLSPVNSVIFPVFSVLRLLTPIILNKDIFPT